MKAIAVVLGLLCVVVAVVYVVVPAGSLPAFLPGFEAGSPHVHIKHGIVAAVAAVVLFAAAWLVGRSR
jgi:hypothetical protein